jgi:hypothetical protein
MAAAGVAQHLNTTRQKGGKAHAMPCHHNLETYLTANIEGAGLAEDPKGPLFRTIGRGTGLLTRTPAWCRDQRCIRNGPNPVRAHTMRT